MDDPLWDVARQALAHSAQRLPGSAGAWIERSRLALYGAADPQLLEPALQRLTAWAPNWPATRRAPARGGELCPRTFVSAVA